MINYYHILGISQKAPAQEIKAAYRKLAFRYHPDKNQDNAYAEGRFKEINHAYQVLSNPSQKARHDLALSYADLQAQLNNGPSGPSFNGASTEGEEGQAGYQAHHRNGAGSAANRGSRARRGSSTSPNFGPGSSYGSRPAPQTISRRQNMIATAWAFGIFILIALLGLGLRSYSNYQEAQAMAEEKEQAIQIYKQAEALYQQGNYRQSLQLLNLIEGQYNIPANTSQLKIQLLSKLEEIGSHLFETGNYAEAAQYYQLLVEQQPYYVALDYARLVSSYEMIPDYPRAIKAYQQVIKEEPASIEARNRLASLLFKQQAYEEALRYYQEASELVSQEYKSYYGEGYPLVMDPGRTPESHYQLHCGLGKTYTLLGSYKQANAAFKWAIFLRPENPEAHYLRGNNFFNDQQPAAACQAWEKARQQGYSPAEAQLLKHCR